MENSLRHREYPNKLEPLEKLVKDQEVIDENSFLNQPVAGIVPKIKKEVDYDAPHVPKDKYSYSNNHNLNQNNRIQNQANQNYARNNLNSRINSTDP